MASRRPRVTRGEGLLEGWLARKRAEVADRLIPADARRGCIVDIGCGRVPYFLIQTAFSQKIGLDKIAGGVPARVLERRDLILIHWDIEKSGYLPLKSNLCAVVVHLAVIEHIEPERVIPLLREMARILQDNGTLIITTPAAWTDRLLRFMARLGLVSAVEIAEHKAAYSRRQLVDLLAQVFDRAQIQAGYFEFGMNIWAVAKKHTGFRGIAGEL